MRRAVFLPLLLGVATLVTGQSVPRDIQRDLNMAWKADPNDCLEALRWLVTLAPPKGGHPVSEGKAEEEATKSLVAAGVPKSLLTEAMKNSSFLQWFITATDPTPPKPLADDVKCKASQAVEAIYESPEGIPKLGTVYRTYTNYPGDHDKAFLLLLEAYPESAAGRADSLAALRAAYGLEDPDWSVFAPVADRIIGTK